MDIDFVDLTRYAGVTFGPGEWLTIDQRTIDEFSRVSGDQAWYHVDRDRAAAELPYGRTLAHGFLTMSLVPALSSAVLRISYRSRALNYGADRVRFPAPVLEGDRIRIRTTPIAFIRHCHGTLLHLKHVVEVDSASKPALSMVRLSLVLDEFVQPDLYADNRSAPANEH
jgi:acyl dehydratase